MGFHEVRFPTDISEGSQGGPAFNTFISDSDSGIEERVNRWTYPRHRFDVSYGIKTYDQIVTVRNFFIAREGATNGFRYKDFTDFHSGSGHFIDAPGTQDQLIGVGDGTTTQFQLIKRYTSGATTKIRNIYKPVSGTVRVWVNSVEQMSGWSVDTTTGVITFTTAPTNTHNIEASFEFDVPVRFSASTDQGLNISADNFGSASIGAIQLIELFEFGPAYVDEVFQGGSSSASFSADVTLSRNTARLFDLTATTTSLSVLLPDPDSPIHPRGGPIFIVKNSGANSFALKDHNGTTLKTVTTGQLYEVYLGEDNVGDGYWIAA